MKRQVQGYGMSSLGPISSQPLDFVGSSEDSALKTSESENDIEH